MSDSTATNIIAEWPKNRREVLRVTVETFKGERIVSLRAYYKDEFGEMKPTRKGIAVAVRHLPRLAEAFAEAERQVRGGG